MTTRRKVGIMLVLLAGLAYVLFAYVADDLAPSLLDYPLMMLVVPALVAGLILIATGAQRAEVNH